MIEVTVQGARVEVVPVDNLLVLRVTDADAGQVFNLALNEENVADLVGRLLLTQPE